MKSPFHRRALAPVALLAMTVSACAQQSAGPSQAQVENEIAARSLMSLWGAEDPQTLAGLFHPDAVYDDYVNQAQYRGLEEIGGYVAHSYDWSSAVDVAPLAVHASADGATVEWVVSATQDRPIGSRVPVATGREVVLNGVTILEFQDGRITRAADYMDALPLMLQLGGEVHLPGGSVLKLDLGDPVSPDGDTGGQGGAS